MRGRATLHLRGTGERVRHRHRYGPNSVRERSVPESICEQVVDEPVETRSGRRRAGPTFRRKPSVRSPWRGVGGMPWEPTGKPSHATRKSGIRPWVVRCSLSSSEDIVEGAAGPSTGSPRAGAGWCPPTQRVRSRRAWGGGFYRICKRAGKQGPLDPRQQRWLPRRNAVQRMNSAQGQHDARNETCPIAGAGAGTLILVTSCGRPSSGPVGALHPSAVPAASTQTEDSHLRPTASESCHLGTH